MTYRKYIFTLIYLYLCTVLHVTSQDQACDKSRCKGPIKYYEDLECVPIYSSEDTCCPVKYNCDHFKGRSNDKCYYRGRVYKLREKLIREDKKLCHIDCLCSLEDDGPAKFRCSLVNCPTETEPGCYLKQSHIECCDGTQVCPQNNTRIAKCEVDGKTYLDGQSFTPESDPTQFCICSEGYTDIPRRNQQEDVQMTQFHGTCPKGKKVAPFCKAVDNSESCHVELYNYDDIHNNCIPVFDDSQNLATDCNYMSRCQNKDDLVVEFKDATKTGDSSLSDSVSNCTFGNLTIKIGDQLKSGTWYTSLCVECVCEVPPIPTCLKLPESECNIRDAAENKDFSI